jgi:hypothetical protein
MGVELGGPGSDKREVMKVKKDICLACGRKRLGEWEGRIIDGSWAQDSSIHKKYLGRWVCSYRCLQELLKKGK